MYDCFDSYQPETLVVNTFSPYSTVSLLPVVISKCVVEKKKVWK